MSKQTEKQKKSMEGLLTHSDKRDITLAFIM